MKVWTLMIHRNLMGQQTFCWDGRFVRKTVCLDRLRRFVREMFCQDTSIFDGLVHIINASSPMIGWYWETFGCLIFFVVYDEQISRGEANPFDILLFCVLLLYSKPKFNYCLFFWDKSIQVLILPCFWAHFVTLNTFHFDIWIF